MIAELPPLKEGKLRELLPLHLAVIRSDDFFSLHFFSLLVDELSLSFDIQRKRNVATVADVMRLPVTITASSQSYEIRYSPLAYATITNVSHATINIVSFATPKQIKRAKLTDLIDQGYFASSTGAGNLYEYQTVRHQNFGALSNTYSFERFVQTFAITWNNFAIAQVNELIHAHNP